MLICEDLLLLVTDPESGRFQHAFEARYAVGGALLLDLTRAECLVVTGPGDLRGKEGRLVRSSAPLPTHPVLQRALALVEPKLPLTPQRAVERISRHTELREAVYAGLATQGLVADRGTKVWGLFPVHRWPLTSTAPQDALKARLHEVLVQGRTPDDEITGLIGLLSAMKLADKVVAAQSPGVDKRAVRARAKEIAESDVLSEGVRKAIQAMQGAVAAAV